MFYHSYNKLSEAYIRAQLDGASAPRHAAPLSDALVGRTLSLQLDGGPTLRYSFPDVQRLELCEDGAAFHSCAYGALQLQNLLLLSHCIPGALHGYQLLLDLERGLVTVFRTAFCGYADNREVQRSIYHGCIEGSAAPHEPRHGPSNRMAGLGFHWRHDDGDELLSFHPSILYSTFVELQKPDGGLTISAPSDYIRLDDRFFLYARVEAEYAGTLVLELIDLASVQKIGLRLGFDEHDALDYRLYRGEGEITGRAASFSPLNDFVGERSVEDRGFDIYAGASRRPVYRPSRLHPPRTQAEVDACLDRGCAVFSGDTLMSGSCNMPYSDLLAGRRFALHFDDGPDWEYEVESMERLRWRAPGEQAWHEELYRAYEPAEGLFFFTHVHTGSRPFRCVSIAVDFSNGLATLLDAHIGNRRSVSEVGNRVYFGVLEYDGLTAPETQRHCFTDELVGKSIAWTYSGDMSSIHVYSSPFSYSWSICQSNFDGGMTWSSPCIYVRLRADAYLFAWVEETCGGNQCAVVFNPRIMHDAGFFFGLFGDQLSLSPLGAYARMAGSYDILHYFKP